MNESIQRLFELSTSGLINDFSPEDVRIYCTQPDRVSAFLAFHLELRDRVRSRHGRHPSSEVHIANWYKDFDREDTWYVDATHRLPSMPPDLVSVGPNAIRRDVERLMRRHA